jgi:hypothetical protein
MSAPAAGPDVKNPDTAVIVYVVGIIGFYAGARACCGKRELHPVKCVYTFNRR